MLKRLGVKMRGSQRSVATVSKNVAPKEQLSQSEGETVPEWLREALECPVCFETMRKPPIFMCESTLAHSLCLTCHRLCRECPICRGTLTDKRSHALEKLIEKLPIASCKNVDCSFRDSDVRLVKKHEEEECEFRTITCMCQEKIRLRYFVLHCMNVHGCKQMEPLKFSYFRKIHTLISPLKGDDENTKLGVVIPYEVERKTEANAVFLMNWTTERNCLVFWMAFLGPRDKAKNFKYSIKIKNCRQVAFTEYVYEGTRACVPCDVSQREMQELRCGILIDRKLIIDASDEHDILHYCVQIEKI